MRVLLLIAGAALAYFFDPDNGKRRRNVARERLSGMLRRGSRLGARTARKVGSDAVGWTENVQNLTPAETEPDDLTLGDRVESEVFRDRNIPKGRISVSVENGVVFLLGMLDRPEQIRDVEDKVRGVAGVRDVQNLLHLPGTPAPEPGVSRGR